ncbi:MAG: ATP-binding protein, partial [Flavobacterium sp.]
MPQFKFNTISRTDILSSPGGAIMINAIDYNGPFNLLITGCPGSGKTTVSIMRAEHLLNQQKTVLLLTYQDLLKVSLKNIASPALVPHINKFYKWFSSKFRFLQPYETETEMLVAMKNWQGVDEIIIDEGQDLEARVYRALIKKCKRLTVGADNAQKVHEQGLTAAQIHAELNATAQVNPVYLQYNYRNTFE